MALVYGLGMGATLMVAFHTGARDVRQHTWAAGTVLVAGAAASVLLSSVGIFCSPTLARFMGAEGRLLDLTLVYLRVTWYLFASYVFLHVAAAILRGAGIRRAR